jgi:hypothetical protein
MPDSASQAIALYGILARDWTDFIDLLPQADEPTIHDLYKILTFTREPKDDNGETDYELNTLGAGVVERHAQYRGIELCLIKKSTSSEAVPTSTSVLTSPSVPKPTDRPPGN